jgi:hypothetical protein
VGTLFYGSPGIEFAFDDRALMHLQIVITAKLRRREGFVFSWIESTETGGGRASIWLDPSSTLYYRFYGGRVPSINREWLSVLTTSANSGNGLLFTPEPGVHVPGHTTANTRGLAQPA